MLLTFSNPRRKAIISNWPLGSNKRGDCTFEVQTGKKGERISRTTTGKPKLTTYGEKCCIVDADNGKTYLLIASGGSVHIASADMKHDAPQDETGRNSAYVYQGFGEIDLYNELMSLIAKAE